MFIRVCDHIEILSLGILLVKGVVLNETLRNGHSSREGTSILWFIETKFNVQTQ